MLWKKIYMAVSLAILTLTQWSRQIPWYKFRRATLPSACSPSQPGWLLPTMRSANRATPAAFLLVDQNGLIRVIQNAVYCPPRRFDLQSLVQPPLVASNPNDERGLLSGLAFNPGFNDPSSPGYRTLYTYNSEAAPMGGGSPTYPVPNGATQNYVNAIDEWKMNRHKPQCCRSPRLAARSSPSARTPPTTTAARLRSARTAICTWERATAEMPTTSARAMSHRSEMPKA